jgi:hypothetical protein
MNTKTLVGLIVLIAIAAAAAFLMHLAPKNSSSTDTVSNEDDQAVRTVIKNFGNSLKMVSLLAPDASTQIQTYYSAYVTPELLASWAADPALATGRQTSSPWPERIDIVNVQINGTRAAVEGSVIEVTSADAPLVPAAVYPVTMALEKRGDTWLITSLAKGAYSELPKQVTVTGIWECLPHKDTNGPQTMECAFGIQADDGSHYAIDTRLMSEYPVDYATGSRVRVQGTLTPVEALSSIQKYDIKGIVSATTIEEI